jgi:probable phosphoglycerate mutase
MVEANDGPADPRAVVLLLRHGESTWNQAGRWQGQADPPLSPRGRRQAEAAAATVGRPAAIWSSDLRRARHTAELLAGPADRVQVETRFRERDVGPWAGLTRAEIDARYPGFLADGRRPARWEDDATVAARALAAARDVAAALPERGVAVVVTHGGLIRGVELHLGASARPVPNLVGRWLRRDGDRFTLGARVHLLGDHDGLAAGPVAAAD